MWIVVAVLFVVWLAWECWIFRCLFFFHQWDKSRTQTDLCLRCGALRFKGGR